MQMVIGLTSRPSVPLAFEAAFGGGSRVLSILDPEGIRREKQLERATRGWREEDRRVLEDLDRAIANLRNQQSCSRDNCIEDPEPVGPPPLWLPSQPAFSI